MPKAVYRCRHCGTLDTCYCCPECGVHVGEADHKPRCSLAPGPAVCSGCGHETGHAATCPVPKTWPACRWCAGCGRAKGNVSCPFCEGRGRLEPGKA